MDMRVLEHFATFVAQKNNGITKKSKKSQVDLADQ